MDHKLRLIIANNLDNRLNKLQKDVWKFRNGDMELDRLSLLFKAEFLNSRRWFRRYLGNKKNPGNEEIKP